MNNHPDREVSAAITRLTDALCTWERSTGRQSLFVLREQGGFVHRAMSGKPVPSTCDDLSDAELAAVIDRD
jgi:hypothetical protein